MQPKWTCMRPPRPALVSLCKPMSLHANVFLLDGALARSLRICAPSEERQVPRASRYRKPQGVARAAPPSPLKAPGPPRQYPQGLSPRAPGSWIGPRGRSRGGRKAAPMPTTPRGSDLLARASAGTCAKQRVPKTPMLARSGFTPVASMSGTRQSIAAIGVRLRMAAACAMANAIYDESRRASSIQAQAMVLRRSTIFSTAPTWW